MVISESNDSRSDDNNFYGVLDEVLHVQYLKGRSIWLFNCRLQDTDSNKSQKTHVELWYKAINTFHFWFAEESIILATHAYQVLYLDDPNNGTNWKVVQVGSIISIYEMCPKWMMPKVDPTIVEIPIVHHVADDFIDNEDEQCHIKVDQATMNDSDEPQTDQMFLEFDEDLNTAEGSFSVRDNSVSTLELERYVHANDRIPMSIAPSVEKPISPYAIQFIQAMDRGESVDRVKLFKKTHVRDGAFVSQAAVHSQMLELQSCLPAYPRGG
ncbi:acidic leucine-rich nuclear phosphoprotein 32 family member A-like [Cucumis melo var. makuwa]|uniref:Acidic leucine-rich nuclear phosphoprotein 32 family member A-like n=1 Tax=Cucumis melo var. makuwa TaxID=1194695 RepID=A0A5A7SN36_CUCMM|nr:acidic leucine-rich nuclear phosphoprotein 32 family member A-like [Cucumis melo var. makuwa]TYK14425.1 acidic leucine-rich nuclear phosphoprotein 32 family member A-like [Cucumis melo var. makuwa]